MTTERDEIVARVKEEILKEIRMGSPVSEHPIDLGTAISHLAGQSAPAWTLTGSWKTKN